MRPLIFLDFDETLVHTVLGYHEDGYEIFLDSSMNARSPWGDDEGSWDDEDSYTTHTVLVRPGAQEFLVQLGAGADLYLYSGGAQNYLTEALEATGLGVYLIDYFSLYNDNEDAFEELELQRRAWLLVDNVAFYGTLVQDKLLETDAVFSEDNFVHVRDFFGHASDSVLLNGHLLHRIERTLQQQRQLPLFTE